MENNTNDVEFYGYEPITINQVTLPSKPVWNPKYFLVLSIFFSHIPFLIFYLINHARLVKKPRNNVGVFIVLISTGLMMVALVAITNESIAKGFVWIVTFSTGFYMKRSQEELYAEHIVRGGDSAKWLLPILSALAFTGIVIAFAIYSINFPAKSMNFFDDEILYTEEVDKLDVEKLGDYLVEGEYFVMDANRASVKLDLSKGIFHVYFVVVEEAVNRADVLEVFEFVKTDLKENVYIHSKGVEVYLCDDRLKVLKKID